MIDGAQSQTQAVPVIQENTNQIVNLFYNQNIDSAFRFCFLWMCINLFDVAKSITTTKNKIIISIYNYFINKFSCLLFEILIKFMFIS